MSVSIFTFANLGEKKNLGTFEIEPVIDIFSRKGELDRVVCQLHKHFYFPRTASAIPSSLHYSLRAIEKLTKHSFPRGLTESLFDFFAQWKIGRSDLALFHGGHFLTQTLHRAHKKGIIVADLTRSAHFATNAAIEKDETNRLGLKDHPGTYQRLYQKHRHQNEFDYIVASSEFVKQSYIAAGFPSERIFIAYPDIDRKKFTPNSNAQRPEGTFKVVYSAFTTPLKGLHYLLDAWEKLRLSDAVLVLVGGYSEIQLSLKQRYDARISRNSSIQWIGASDVPEKYFHDASVLVFPSLTEGFGKVTQEAMASGLPVITTENARGLVEDGKTGFVVPIRNADAIAEKIRYLYDHRDIAEQMGREGRKVVEAKKPFGEVVYEIYQEIMRREGKL